MSSTIVFPEGPVIFGAFLNQGCQRNHCSQRSYLSLKDVIRFGENIDKIVVKSAFQEHCNQEI